MASVSGTKRLNSDDNDVHTPKIQRVEHHSSHGNGNGLPAAHHAGSSPHQRLPTANNDFSGSVKRKLADSKRTGQACDRCKVSAPSFPPSPSPPLLYLGAGCSAVQCGAVYGAVCLCWMLHVAYCAPPRRILHVYRPGEALLHASHAEIAFATRRDGRAGSRRLCTGPYRYASRKTADRRWR
jgi:hypothetical protein